MQNKKQILASLSLWLIAILLLVFCFWHFSGQKTSGKGTELRFIDVGNADCCLLTSEAGGNILIDCGNPGDGELIQAHMRQREAVGLDAVFISHFHTDHMGGLLDLLEDGETAIGEIYYPNYQETNENKEKIEELARERQIPMTPLSEGEQVTVGAFQFSVLLPKNIISTDAAFSGEDDENNRSMVLQMHYGNTSALFVGDLEADGESFLQFEEGLKSDILKVGHHGAATSSTEAFLQKVQPVYAVVPTGQNSYGHPNRKVLERLENLGIKVLRSDQCGTLRFLLSEENIEDVIAEKKVR